MSDRPTPPADLTAELVHTQDWWSSARLLRDALLVDCWDVDERVAEFMAWATAAFEVPFDVAVAAAAAARTRVAITRVRPWMIAFDVRDELNRSVLRTPFFARLADARS